MSAGRAVLGGGLLFLAGFLLLTAVVTRQSFDQIDLLARTLVHQSHHPALQGFMEAASLLGGEPGQVAVVLLGSVLLWPRRRRWALALPVMMAGVGVVQFLAKWSIDRDRPNLQSLGFPSAHVLSLVVLLGSLAYVASLMTTRRGWQGLALGAAAGLVGVVAYSRMYLDAHWLSDVLGGFMAGVAYVLVAIWTIDWAPHVGRAWRIGPLERPVDGLLVPAPTGPAADPLIAVTTALAPATPTPDSR